MAAAFLLVPAMPASAHIESFFIEGVERDQLDPGMWTYPEVNGTIDCTEGEKFLVTAKVIDDDFIGKGRTRGTCTGQLESWFVTLDQQPGSGFGDGCSERIAAKAHTKINGVHHDQAVDRLPCPF